MAIATLDEMFRHALADVRSAEEQILDSLPNMIAKAQNEELKSNLEAHLEETKEQKRRIDEIVSAMGESLDAVTCMGIQGILKEGEEMLGEVEGELIDAAVAAAAGKVEHYEVASYRSLIELADNLDLDDVVSLLEVSLEEEESAAKKVEKAFEEGVSNLEF